MSAASKAYKAAEVRIAQAIKTGETILSFDSEEFRALETIPPQIAEIAGLKYLDLHHTNISDIAPLQALTAVQRLYLDNTNISDIAPLQALTAVQSLYLHHTNISDIAPLQALTAVQSLYLHHTNISDIAPLQALTAVQSLYLHHTNISDIAPLQALTAVQSLYLHHTNISDIAPLQALTAVQILYLDNTNISDIAPLQALTALQSLTLHQTNITDLRPIQDLEHLGRNSLTGLNFSNTPATRADAELKRLSEIEDDKERADQTRAYLKTLPPYPAPLPWEAQKTQEIAEPNTDPDQDANLALVWGDNGFSFFAQTVQADPVTLSALEDVQTLLDALIRQAGNHHEDLYQQALEMKQRCDAPAHELNLLKLHLSYQKLKRIYEGRTGRQRMLDDETVTTLSSVLELVPGVTLADEQVQTLIARQDANRALPDMDVTAQRERKVLQAMAEDDAPMDSDVRGLAQDILEPDQIDRLAATRPILSHNAVIAVIKTIKWLGVTAVTAAVGHWTVLHLETLQSLALSMGDDVYWWAKAILDKLKALFEARNLGP